MSAAALLSDLAKEIQAIEASNARLASDNDALRADVIRLNARISELEKIAQQPAPVPTPEPVPAPPAPDTPPAAGPFEVNVQNMSLKDGVYRSNDLGADQKCYVQLRSQNGLKAARFEYSQRTNVVPDGTKNLKDGRNWTSATYPNDYTGRSLRAGSHQIACENGDGVVLYHHKDPSRWTVAYFDMPFKKDAWQTVVKEFRYASAPGKADGWVRITVDGRIMFESGGWLAQGTRNQFGVQMVYAPNSGDSGKLPAGSYLEVKGISLK